MGDKTRAFFIAQNYRLHVYDVDSSYFNDMRQWIINIYDINPSKLIWFWVYVTDNLIFIQISIVYLYMAIFRSDVYVNPQYKSQV